MAKPKVLIVKSIEDKAKTMEDKEKPMEDIETRMEDIETTMVVNGRRTVERCS